MASASTPFLAFSLIGPTTVGPLAVPAGVSCFAFVCSLVGLLAGQVVWLTLEISTDGGITWQPVATCDFTVATGAADLSYTLGQNPDGSQRVSGTGWQFHAVLSAVGGPIAVGAGTLSAV